MSYRQDADRNFAKHIFHGLLIPSGSSIYISVTGRDILNIMQACLCNMQGFSKALRMIIFR